MDLAIYINELLGLKGEVNVPGVGFFAQKRVNGYYNESEGKFYPPRHEIVFDPVSKDDDGLAEYISRKKNISPASAKYFIEKYATALRQGASTESTPITGLGHLFYEYSTLTFKADKDARQNDPAFYGMEPVEVYKKPDKSELTEETPPARAEEPKPEPVPVDAVPAEEGNVEEEQHLPVLDTQPVYEEEYEEEPVRNRSRVWIIVLLFVIVGLLCFSVAYQYKPEWFGKHRPVDTMIIVNGPPPAKPDSATSSKADTTAKAVPAPSVQNNVSGLNIDSTKSHWEVFLSAVKGKTKADEEIANYKAAGVPAFISPDAKGKKLIKIIAGSYPSEAEAEKAKNDLIKTGKVPKNIYSLEIKPKK